ncbi:MAG: cell division protein FtsQ/DivIB [Lachnospiraceae bacterium]|nr:cell division protein FtsQ/DivIB [Lachnospiraceae bacterium]
MAKAKKTEKVNNGSSGIKMIFKYNLTKFIVPFIIVLLLGIGIFAFKEGFEVKQVTVEGSTHYTTDEITNYVLDSKLCRNTVFVYLKYNNKSIRDIPFVEQIDVKIVDRNTVKINVYEKYVAGCVYHLGNYLYFDNNGTIVEASKMKTENIPVVTGLTFTYFNLYEPLPVEDTAVFNNILTITKLLNKNSLTADIIYFDENYNVTLFFDEVRVSIGTDKNLDEKFSTLPLILPDLKGKKGVLHMENFSDTNGNVVFNIDTDTEVISDEEPQDTVGIILVE